MAFFVWMANKPSSMQQQCCCLKYLDVLVFLIFQKNFTSFPTT